MQVALFSAIFVIVAGLVGFAFKPTEEQTRPLAPEPGAAGDDHGHGHGHDHGHHH